MLRSVLWRLGRRTYCWARGDGPNDPRRNGEYWLLEKVIRAASTQTVVIDVGANVGAWSRHALNFADSAMRPVRLFAFEPCAGTREMLKQGLPADRRVEVVPFALSSREGEADFFSDGPGSGTSSFSCISGGHQERVRLTTLDRFLADRGIGTVAMVKIDTEGFDLDVVRGARDALAGGRIDVVQFEYNWRWIPNHATLFDVFHMIATVPYRLGKLVGQAIEFYDTWHPELERFFENNFVLVRRGSPLEALGRSGVFDKSNVFVPGLPPSARSEAR